MTNPTPTLTPTLTLTQHSILNHRGDTIAYDLGVVSPHPSAVKNYWISSKSEGNPEARIGTLTLNSHTNTMNLTLSPNTPESYYLAKDESSVLTPLSLSLPLPTPPTPSKLLYTIIAHLRQCIATTKDSA